MDIEVQTEELKIDFIGLVNGFGGSIGLFLGYSCVTFIEGAIFIFMKFSSK